MAIRIKPWLAILLLTLGVLLASVIISSTYLTLSARSADPLPLEVSIGTSVEMKISNYVVQIQPEAIDGRSCLYRWEVCHVLSGVHLSGTGVVSEVVATNGLFRSLDCDRTEGFIVTGPVCTQWSYCGPTSIWVYYHPQRTVAKVRSWSKRQGGWRGVSPSPGEARKSGATTRGDRPRNESGIVGKRQKLPPFP